MSVSEDDHLLGRLAMSSVPDDQASVKSSEDASGSRPRIKFLCSYGGKILPKPDGQLRYVGGDTRLLSVRRNIGFADLQRKLEKLFGPNLWMKYQLPNEDLDALISVTCDEDVDNLIEEYDRNEARDGASRLRAYLFPRAEMPSRAVFFSSDQLLEEAKSPQSFADQKSVETMNGQQRALARMQLDSPSVAFQGPDYLLGLDSGGHNLSHHPQQQDRDSLSPRLFHSPVEKGSLFPAALPPLKDPTPMPLQADYARQQSHRMDSGGRSPALITSALGPLTSGYHHSWENRKWDAGVPGDQKDDKRPVELNGEASYVKAQRDACAESAIARISSKDRIVSMYMDASHAEAHLMTDRQGRLPPIIHMERHTLEDVHTDVSPDVRHEAAGPGGFWLHRPPEMPRIPQPTPNIAASEVQWGLPKPSGAVFEVNADRATDGLRNSGDDDGMHRRAEGQVIVDNASHPHPTLAVTEGPVDGFKFQDGLEAYPGAETAVLQPLNQQRQGEFELTSPVNPQLEAAQYFHRLGKSHFQPVYWQLRDLQEHHHQHQPALHEPIRVVHNSSTMQRPLHHLQSSGQGAYHHYVPPRTVRTIQRPDTLSNTRYGSPLYRQAAMAGALRPDAQQLSRGASPLREHPTGHDAHNSPRYGHGVVQLHEIGYLPSTIAHQSSGPPVPPVYVTDAADAHNFYDQGAGHLPRVPSPLHEHATGNDISSSRYGHRVVTIPDRGYLPSTIAHQTTVLPVSPVYGSDAAEAHCLYDQKGVTLPRAPSPLREHSGQRLLQVHETGYMPTSISQQSSGLPVAPVYVSDLAGAHNLYDQNGGQLHDQLQYSEKGIKGNLDASVGQVQYTDKVANHDAATGQTHHSDDKLQNPQYVLKGNNQDAQGVPLHQDAAGAHSHQ